MLVSGFYDLERFETRRTPQREWLRRAEWLLSQHRPLLFFCDEDFQKALGLEQPTIAVPGPPPDFSDLEHVRRNLERSQISWDPLKDTPRYFCLMRHRIRWMVIAATYVPADEVLVWTDMALPHREGETLDEVLGYRPTPGKIRICEISYVPGFARDSVLRYYERHWWPVGGGLWAARAPEIQWLADEIDKEWRLSLEAGYVATDEMLIGRVLIRHPERFEVYYGDHPSLAANWVAVKDHRRLIAEMAVRALEDGNVEEGLRRCRALRGSL